jgi:hypothetical protein
MEASPDHYDGDVRGDARVATRSSARAAASSLGGFRIQLRDAQHCNNDQDRDEDERHLEGAVAAFRRNDE